jgi:hypothetical protein
LTSPVGGEKYGFACAGLLGAALTFDFESMLGRKGLEFFTLAPGHRVAIFRTKISGT